MSVIAAFAVPHPPIIVPEVGKGEEKKIAKTTAAYEDVMRRIAALKPETIVVTSPHSVMYADYFHISPGGFARGDLGRFRPPAGDAAGRGGHAQGENAEQGGVLARRQGRGPRRGEAGVE